MIPTENTGTWEALTLSRSSLTVFPLTHSVASELEAMAEPQPKVLKRASTILPFSSTSTCGSILGTFQCPVQFGQVPPAGLSGSGTGSAPGTGHGQGGHEGSPCCPLRGHGQV